MAKMRLASVRVFADHT